VPAENHLHTIFGGRFKYRHDSVEQIESAEPCLRPAYSDRPTFAKKRPPARVGITFDYPDSTASLITLALGQPAKPMRGQDIMASLDGEVPADNQGG
jgi:hypothetical protein